MENKQQTISAASKFCRGIILAAHNSEWGKQFLVEKELIEDCFKALNNNSDNLVEILHIGSTAVEGLLAKPIIDIMVVVKDVYASDAFLVKASYHYKGEYNIPMRKLYGKKGEFEIYLHLYEEGNHHIALHQTFRDYLIKQPQARAAYAQLKQAIIDHDASHTKLSTTSITYYNLKKHAFIASIIEASGCTGLCIRLCSHHEEWISYHALLQQALVKKQLSHCVYQDNLSNPDYKNIVLYKGHQIIGAAQVHVNSLKACLHFCEIDKSIPVEERQELQAFLRQQIAKLLKNAFHVNDFTAPI